MSGYSKCISAMLSAEKWLFWLLVLEGNSLVPHNVFVKFVIWGDTECLSCSHSNKLHCNPEDFVLFAHKSSGSPGRSVSRCSET